MSLFFCSLYFFSLDAAELIELNIFTADWHGVHFSSGGNMLLPDDRKGKQSIIIFGSGIYFSNKMYSINVYFSNKMYGIKAEGIATLKSAFKDNKVMLTILIF